MGSRPALALLDILRGEGVDRVFGNPGTTELPFLAALSETADAPEYVLGVHEGAVVSMAFLALAEDRRPPHRTLPRLTPRTLVLPGQLARDLALTRARGFGVNLEEAEVGVSAVAAPVYARGRDSRPIAAISVTGGTRRLDVDRLGARVCAAARALTRALSA